MKTLTIITAAALISGAAYAETYEEAMARIKREAQANIERINREHEQRMEQIYREYQEQRDRDRTNFLLESILLSMP
jgi:vacuolar-type H+-ATPase subunit E/Vma4